MDKKEKILLRKFQDSPKEKARRKLSKTIDSLIETNIRDRGYDRKFLFKNFKDGGYYNYDPMSRIFR